MRTDYLQTSTILCTVDISELNRVRKAAGWVTPDRMSFARKGIRQNLQSVFPGFIAQLIEHRANREEDSDEASELLYDILISTNRLTLYTERTDFGALVENARNDYALNTHQRRIFDHYRDAGNGVAERILRSDNAAPWREFNGFEIFDHYVVPSDDCSTCPSCNERCMNESMDGVYTSEDLDQELYCSSCRGDPDYVFFCNVSGYYFSTNMTEETLSNGESFCLEYCESNNLVEYDDDEEEWNATGRGSQGTALLMDYHRALRPWAQRSASTPRQAIGVELEVGFAAGVSGRAKFLKQWSTPGTGRAKGLPFCFERDGSLDGAGIKGGLEIISDPLSLRDGYQLPAAAWRVMLDALKEYRAEGWKHRDHAGIHVNLDVQHVTREDVLKYAVFISNAAALSKFIAGRKFIYNHENHSPTAYKKMYSGGFVQKRMNTFDGMSPSTALAQIASEGKYAPVFLRPDGNCIETRIFGSNLRYEGFMATVEYCVAVLEYVQTIPVHEVFSPILSPMFRAWLGEKTSKYPNLASRLGIVAHSRAIAVPPTAKIIPVLAYA